MKTVFISAASSVLGRELTSCFLNRGYLVVAHYFSRLPENSGGIIPVWGDFRSESGLKDFFKKNSNCLKDAQTVLQLYGPLLWKDTADLHFSDFNFSFWNDFFVSMAFFNFFKEQKNFKQFVAFDFLDKKHSYQKILAYAVAKRAQRLWLRSVRRNYPAIRVQLIAFSSYQQAEFIQKDEKLWSPAELAERITGVIEAKGKFFTKII